jgi:hypothetical protein
MERTLKFICPFQLKIMCVSLVYLVKKLHFQFTEKIRLRHIQQSNEAFSISTLYLLLKDVKERTRDSFYLNFADEL